MTNRELFLYPGEQVFYFFLSVVQGEPTFIAYELAHAGVIICALLSWALIFRVCFEIVKKLFGFSGGPRHG